MEQTQNKQPLAKVKAGQISASLWENTAVFNNRQVTMIKATLQRSYKDKNGQWQTTSSFSRNDIPLAIYCLNKAFDIIIEMDAKRNQESRAQPDNPQIPQEYVGP